MNADSPRCIGDLAPTRFNTNIRKGARRHLGRHLFGLCRSGGRARPKRRSALLCLSGRPPKCQSGCQGQLPRRYGLATACVVQECGPIYLRYSIDCREKRRPIKQLRRFCSVVGDPSSPARLAKPINRLVELGFLPQSMIHRDDHGPHLWTMQPRPEIRNLR
jgi:hypothetical protein